MAVGGMPQAVVGRKLYYYTWKKEGSTHYYEVDFLIPDKSKIIVFEVKSSVTGKHESILMGEINENSGLLWL